MRHIFLSKGRLAQIDDEDFERVSALKWTSHSGGYAYASKSSRTGQKYVLLHRFIVGAQPGNFVDHIDGNKLNNTRANLRTCTQAENNRNTKKTRVNTSGFKGVSYYRPTKRWRARLKLGQKTHYLGYYSDVVQAAQAYDAAARVLQGEFARLNFPLSHEQAA